MKLTITRSKNAVCFYVQKSVRKENGKISSVTIEKLGNLEQVKTRACGKDPYKWAKDYVEELNRKEYEEHKEIIVSFSPSKLIEKDKQKAFNCAYLFLQDIYYDLKLDKICRKISEKYSFKYDLNDVLSKLIFTRILYPASKLSSYALSKKLLEQPSFNLQDIYRGLTVLAKENDYIQAELYKNSQKILERRKDILYYDCTNYYFEIEMEDDFRLFGKSKQNQPHPLVGMGLFMDADGIPMAFTMFPGSVEAGTMRPLEKKIIKDFGVDNLVVCTDAGLSSTVDRKFNDLQLGGVNVRSFITVQSLKKMKARFQEWALDTKGWHLIGDKNEYDLSKLDDEKDKDKIFYKEQWIKEDISRKKEKAGVKPLEQRLIVSYSIKYRNYLRHIREGQLERAQKMIEKGDDRPANTQNNPRRFIAHNHSTEDGEVCTKDVAYLNTATVSEEEKYDGFYAVCTNLEKTPIDEIIRVNKKRWEIEECFRIMKTDFLAGTIFLQRKDRITAHFLTCFIALFIYRILEKKLNDKYTCEQILSTLKDMMILRLKDNAGYTPAYTRTDITDALHEAFGFRTDYEITSNKSIRSIISKTKK